MNHLGGEPSSLSEQKRSTKARAYRMKKRAEDVDATRRRIVAAAVELHTTVGPANTSISALAEKAGVTRLTVYRHFPDEERLFAECRQHWIDEHPPPDPSGWRLIEGLADRACAALSDLYGWYEANQADLYPIERDAHSMPPSAQETERLANAELAAALIAGAGLRGKHKATALAVAGHVASFSTWRSLVIELGLDTSGAVGVAVSFLMGAIEGQTYC